MSYDSMQRVMRILEDLRRLDEELQPHRRPVTQRIARRIRDRVTTKRSRQRAADAAAKRDQRHKLSRSKPSYKRGGPGDNGSDKEKLVTPRKALGTRLRSRRKDRVR